MISDFTKTFVVVGLFLVGAMLFAQHVIAGANAERMVRIRTVMAKTEPVLPCAIKVNGIRANRNPTVQDCVTEANNWTK